MKIGPTVFSPPVEPPQNQISFQGISPCDLIGYRYSFTDAHGNIIASGDKDFGAVFKRSFAVRLPAPLQSEPGMRLNLVGIVYDELTKEKFEGPTASVSLADSDKRIIFHP